jgi:hypothetical protein
MDPLRLPASQTEEGFQIISQTEEVARGKAQVILAEVEAAEAEAIAEAGAEVEEEALAEAEAEAGGADYPDYFNLPANKSG